MKIRIRRVLPSQNHQPCERDREDNICTFTADKTLAERVQKRRLYIAAQPKMSSALVRNCSATDYRCIIHMYTLSTF